MDCIKMLIPLREYCRQNEWPRLPQWHHWIYRKHPLAVKCVKKIGGRYMIDQKAFAKYISEATLGEAGDER